MPASNDKSRIAALRTTDTFSSIKPDDSELNKEPNNMFWKKKVTAPATVFAEVEAKTDDILSHDSSFDSESEDISPALNLKDPGFGINPAIKTFYEGKNSRPGNYNWVDTPPKQLPEKSLKANTRVAIKIFKVRDGDQAAVSGFAPLRFQEVELQSPILVAALKPILKELDVFIEATEPAKFIAPFQPLFFSYDKIMKLHARTRKGGLLKEHLDLLVQVIGQLFTGFISQLKRLKASGLITYKLAWAYFPKGTMIYCSSRDTERICRVVRTSYNDLICPALDIDAEEIAFDGDNFAWKPITISIPKFNGNLPVTGLPNYPLSFHKDSESVKERLTVRAKKVIEYQGLEYCEYMGIALQQTSIGVSRHNVDGRILIDYFGYSKHIQRGHRNSGKVNDEDNIYGRRKSISSGVDINSEESRDTQNISKKRQEENKREILKRKTDLTYVSPLLMGFFLKSKEWLNFHIDDIKPISWNDEAYDHLVYPEVQKDLVLTFVDNHKRLRAQVDDVIVGKGQGLIVLLSGPPGTGKTLTAEAVADKTRRPLYYLQAEELGTDAGQLGQKIKKVFEMATEWDAVILLDEADVFMAKRDPSDIARNELVSIFLRELEYFRGIIFLTTNLYSTIDTAFRSRVHMHLVFSPLSFSSRLILWEKSLSHVGNPVVLKEQEMEELARWEMNGREIKNAIKTAKVWCISKNLDMDLHRLESAIKVTAPQVRKVEMLGGGDN